MKTTHYSIKNKGILGLVAIMILGIFLTACGSKVESNSDHVEKEVTPNYRIIKDMWGREVKVKDDVKTAVIMEWEGLVAKSMKVWGLEDNIIGVDNTAKNNSFRKTIIPAIDNLPAVGSPYGGVNYEEIAKLKPDIVFMELWITNETEKEMHESAMKRIEDLGIPVIGLLSPSCQETPSFESAWQFIRLVGEVYNKQTEAEKLISSLDGNLQLIKDRTSNLTEDEKADVVIYNTNICVMGRGSIQSYFLTEILNANNLVEENTGFIQIAEEQLLTYEPDVLVVMGHDGYLTPSVIYEGKHIGLNWNNLKEFKPIKNRRVVSLGYEEWRTTIETPVGLLKIAKELYPDLFQDIDVEAEELKMYMEHYGFSKDDAAKIMEAQKFTGELFN
ncbi:MAG: ABC transporter substrate-binding protein [Clostridia bacterium]|nr:ABC transporter substrate-binding protein [Clostridia bacterium]